MFVTANGVKDVLIKLKMMMYIGKVHFLDGEICDAQIMKYCWIIIHGFFVSPILKF